jgi:hypothetical protein
LDAIEYYLQIDVQSYINNHPGLIKAPINTSSIRDRFIRIRLKSIQILMSIVSLPFHYERLEQYLFEDYLEKSHDVQTTIIKTFSEYRLKIFSLLLAALQTEQDTTNAQLLFGLKFSSKKKTLIIFEFYFNRYNSISMFISCSL